MMQVIRAGHKVDCPQRGQLVTVKCCGRLEDGTEIDRHDELKLVLGDADFIDGETVLLWRLPTACCRFPDGHILLPWTNCCLHLDASNDLCHTVPGLNTETSYNQIDALNLIFWPSHNIWRNDMTNLPSHLTLCHYYYCYFLHCHTPSNFIDYEEHCKTVCLCLFQLFFCTLLQYSTLNSCNSQ